MTKARFPALSLALLPLALIAGAGPALAQSATEGEMSFFVSSVGSGDGANFGGLDGADAHCNTLAKAVGSPRTFAAYLSTSMVIDRSGDSMKITDGVSARDRIGAGPWYNAKGIMVAADVDDLHSANVNINAETALDD